MDEIATTVTKLLDQQQKLNERASPEARTFYELGHTLGRLALHEEKEMWHYKATHDKLTGALNREGLEEYLKPAVTPKAVLYVDATNFKAVNDSYDHDRGDQVIKETYKTLKSSLRGTDLVARWGGDEFVIVLNGNKGSSVPPDHPMAYEYKQREQSAIEHIAGAKQRIADKVQDFLNKNPDLKPLGFDLAVGGAVWEGQPLNELVRLAEEDSKGLKQEQHETGGQYRGPNPS